MLRIAELHYDVIKLLDRNFPLKCENLRDLTQILFRFAVLQNIGQKFSPKICENLRD